MTAFYRKQYNCPVLPLNPLQVFKLKDTVHINRHVGFPDSCVYGLVLSHSGVFYLPGLLSEENMTIKFSDLQEGSQLRELEGHTREVTCITISPDGNTLASGSKDGSVRLWCPQTADCRQVIPGAHYYGVYCIAFCPDSTSLASGGGDYCLKQWSVDSSSTKPTSTFTGHDAPNCVVYASPTQIISGVFAELRVWDVATEACTHVLAGHTQEVFGLYMSAGGGVLISSSLDGTIKRWGLRQGTGRWECITTLDCNFGGPFSLASHARAGCVSVAPGGDFAVSGACDRHIRVWNLKTGVCLKVLRDAHTAVLSLALSKDGSTVISGGFHCGAGTLVKVWQLYE